MRDLTGEATFDTGSPAIAAVHGNVVRPVAEGVTSLTVRVPGAAPARVRVIVRAAPARAVSFRQEVIPALTRAGCNAGACHGTPNGKSGFRLSLQGYAPEFDYAQLALQAGGRRANRADPGASLLLLKPMARLPHGGGRRLTETMPEFVVLTRWIAEGLRDDPPDLPRVERLEVTPAARVLLHPARSQQLLVRAFFSDGTRRDVTPLAKFSPSDDTVATVSREGQVHGLRRGEAAIQCRYQHLVANVRLTFVRPVPGFTWPDPPAAHAIDRALEAKQKLLRIPPSDIASDGEFLRRAFLDTIGLLPTAEEARAFLGECARASSVDVRRYGSVDERTRGRKDGRTRAGAAVAGPSSTRPYTRTSIPSSRARLIDRLLQRPEFADQWALKWADLLRVNEAALREDGVRVYHRWLREAVAADMPLDRFARELLVATGRPTEQAPANFYYAVADPENWMETTAQLFLGVRINCARCHNHPFDRWTQDEYYQLAAFFAQVQRRGGAPTEGGSRRRERLVTLDPHGEVIQPRTGKVMLPKLLGGPVLTIPPGEDRRPHLAQWLVSKENPFFARALANRIWFHVIGRGVVEPVDDFRSSNPPVSDALLGALADELVKHGFRLRPLVRFIMTSRAYQRSARPERLNRDDTLYFSRAEPRMLTAEQLLDAISQFTGVPERFEGFPEGTRAGQLPGVRLPNRMPFLKAFGRPDRTLACECERERDSNLYQALQLITSRTIDARLRSDQGRLARLAASKEPTDRLLDDLFLSAFTRLPTPKERAAARRHLASGNRRQAFEDLGWALINSKEFVFRH